MKKLFLIRLENGNCVIAQAENEQEALDFAGFGIDLEDIARRMKSDVPTAHWSLVQSGVGPQRVQVRELHEFACDLELTDGGEFEFILGNWEGAKEEILESYPEINKALDAIDARDDPRLTTDFAREALNIAVNKERTRLIVPES
jgi:hypothetical protein